MTRDDYIKLHKQTIAAIELVQKHGADNCIIECSDDMLGERWLSISEPNWCERYYRARLKPQPRLVMWESLDEVPLTHWFMRRSDGDLLKVESVKPESISSPVMIGSYWPTFSELLRDYKHAAPCDKYSDLIWLPCGNEVVE